MNHLNQIRKQSNIENYNIEENPKTPPSPILENNCNYDFKMVCNKENIHLKRDKVNNMFLLQLNASNSNINLYDIVNFNIYRVLYELNKDKIEKIEIKKVISHEEIEVLFVFKELSKDIGLKRKYMYLHVKIQDKPNQRKFLSHDIEYENMEELKGYERIRNDYSILIVNFENQHKININYFFKFVLVEELPIYMENILGLLMKKLFFNLKLFIENLK